MLFWRSLWIVAATFAIAIQVNAQAQFPSGTGVVITRSAQEESSTPTALNPDLHAPLSPATPVVAFKVFPVLTGKPFKTDVHTYKVMTIPQPVLQDGKPLVINGVAQTELHTDTQDTYRLLVRDSQGRVTDRATSAAYPAKAELMGRLGLPPGSAGISDPVTMVNWRWGLQPNQVSKSQIPADALRTPDEPLTRCMNQNGQTKTLARGVTEHFEDLGERTVQNLVVRGCRITTVRPPGPPDSGPVQSTLENWVSPDLRAVILGIEHTPNSDQTTQFENIVTGEPDASLFSPPANYVVKDLNNDADMISQLERAGVRQEDIVGPWEAEDPIAGNGIQIGIFVHLMLRKAARTVRGAIVAVGPDSFTGMQVGVYRKMGDQYDERRLDVGQDLTVQSATWDGNKLHVDFGGGKGGVSRVNGQEVRFPPTGPGEFATAKVVLDLTFSSKDHAWVRTYAVDGTPKEVRMMRPGAPSMGAASSFAGVWILPITPRIHDCYQIVERQDGTFAVWENAMSGIELVLANLHGVPGDPVRGSPIGTAREDDGQPYLVSIQGDEITLTVANDVSMSSAKEMWSNGSGPIGMKGTLSSDKSQIVLPSSQYRPRGRNFLPPVFHRVSDGVCSVEESGTTSGQ